MSAYIKKYADFVKESKAYKYGCVMIELAIENWKGITSVIDEEDIYTEEGDDTYGIQENPHLTLLYGLHDKVTLKQVRSVFNSFPGQISIRIDGINVFENEKFDVVKFNVAKDAGLQYLHDQLTRLPNSNEYPEYKPHVTISYVKKGTGAKYFDAAYKMEIKDVTRACYSQTNGTKSYFFI